MFFFSEEVCLKTEIQWEDDWLNYMNDIYEFAIQMTETSLRELTLDPIYHLREAKECPTFLAVFEKYTGTTGASFILITWPQKINP